MKKELDQALCRDFPHVFANRSVGMRKTAMCWGFPGEGWEPLIREASTKLEPLIVAEITKDPEAWEHGFFTTSQIKEKFGTLRWYLSSGTDEMYNIVDEAEKKSETTCEKCGAPGKLRGRGWYYTSCNNCSKPEDRDNLEYLEQKYDEQEKKK